MPPEPQFPPVAFLTCIAFVAGAGVIANCTLLCALLKSTKNGLTAIVVQLAVADILILGTLAGPELWFYNSHTWIFGKATCTAYRGLSVFAATASSYLIVTIALHAIATANIEETKDKRLKTNCEDDRLSHCSLVPNSETSTLQQAKSKDLRVVENRIRVGTPTLFVWVLSASLSIPEFLLATTVNINEEITLCTSNDSHRRFNMLSILTALNSIMPSIIMGIANIIVICKHKSKKKICLQDSTLTGLKLSFYLITFYFVFCFPRSIINIHSTFNSWNESAAPDNERLDFNLCKLNLGFSATYAIAAALRPVITMGLKPRLLNIFPLQLNKTVI